MPPLLLVFLISFRSLALQWDKMKPGAIASFPTSLCASGGTSYYALIEPKENLHPNKFFIEFMGAMMCFNEASCNDSEFRKWLDIETIMKDSMGAPKDLRDVLRSGLPIPLGLLFNEKFGYLPFDQSHPMWGRRGVFVVACSMDIFVGRHNCSYSKGHQTHHVGGVTVRGVVNELQKDFKDPTEVSLFGGSGGGVGSVAWMEEMALAFPTAQVNVVADSAFHVFPASPLYAFFYENACWSPSDKGPYIKAIYEDVKVPLGDWHSKDVIVQTLTKFAGRVKIAYLGCINDKTVLNDHAKLTKYADFKDPWKHDEVTWAFLLNLHTKAPAGTSYSYVQEGGCHHQMRGNWAPAIPGQITPQDFVANFLKGLPPGGSGKETEQAFWCCGKKFEKLTQTNAGRSSSRISVFLVGVITSWAVGA